MDFQTIKVQTELLVAIQDKRKEYVQHIKEQADNLDTEIEELKSKIEEAEQKITAKKKIQQIIKDMEQHDSILTQISQQKKLIEFEKLHTFNAQWDLIADLEINEGSS
eukprot:NODE_38_length_35257_cov_0.939047.p31 type:complete len:108 gc:universal NODE_38_length_35257_cov_0.939047:18777-18454(-)